jgi:hypothetical protein
MSSAPRAMEMSIDQSSAPASLAVPGSKATGRDHQRVAVRVADLDVLPHGGHTSFDGSASSRPAGVAFTVIGCTKIASGLG